MGFYAYGNFPFAVTSIVARASKFYLYIETGNISTFFISLATPFKNQKSTKILKNVKRLRWII